MPCLDLATRRLAIYSSAKCVVLVDGGGVEQIEFERNLRGRRRKWLVQQKLAHERASVTNFAECFKPQTFDLLHSISVYRTTNDKRKALMRLRWPDLSDGDEIVAPST